MPLTPPLVPEMHPADSGAQRPEERWAGDAKKECASDCRRVGQNYSVSTHVVCPLHRAAVFQPPPKQFYFNQDSYVLFSRPCGLCHIHSFQHPLLSDVVST
ncbi:hypothetical protein M378DRAFT_18319 [Amanita muscaria Koide BX008]|uniref:Uncharacterized protein n=1 Tax=Amanita muscaria (strain Koide BX008) TaxID=946122 RepID=A0A0C2WG17_AMAMK|nr:hypothetical protein M378DRAFT_18319 [Amanita muscaria Koide BX008]